MHNFCFKVEVSITFFIIKFLKRKKRKKKKVVTSSGGFKKSKFFQKNTTRFLTRMLFGIEILKLKKCWCELNCRVEIFLKTRRAWTFFSWNWNLPLLSFYLFFYFARITSACYDLKSKKVELKYGYSLERVWIFKTEKRDKIPCRLFFCFKNLYSFLDLILWVLKITFCKFF